jgi:DNA repair protein RadC
MPLNHSTATTLDLLQLFVPEQTAAELMALFPTLEELLVHATRLELERVKGLGKKRVAQLKAVAELAHRLYRFNPSGKKTVVRSPKDVYELCLDLQFCKLEEARAILLDTKNQVIGMVTIALGSTNKAIIDTKQVFPAAMKAYSSSVILVHSHPSGDPTPSQEDIELTNRLQLAGEHLNIEILDHIVIGKGKYISLKEQGLI